MSADISSDDGETVVQGPTRRDYLKRIGVVSGSAVVIGAGGEQIAPRYSPVGRAQAAAPAVAIGVIGGAAAVKYLTGKSVGEHAIDLFTGDDRDYSGYTGADALHQEIVIGATEMQSADERVMTSIENNITNSENVALAKGKKAILEEMNAENPEEDAQAALEEAINDYYSTIQENIITHVSQQSEQVIHHLERVGSHDDLSTTDLFNMRSDDGLYDNNVISPYSVETATVTLFDGSEIELSYPSASHENSTSGPATRYILWDHPDIDASDIDEDVMGFEVTDPDGGSSFYYNNTVYEDAWTELYNSRDSVLADLSGFVSDVYDQYEPGDIPTEDLVDPITAATELRQNYDNAAGQGAHAAMLGIPTTADFSALLHIYADDDELQESDEDYWDVWAEIYTSYVPREQLHEQASIDSSGTLSVDFEPDSDVTFQLVTTDEETVDVDGSEFSSGSIDLSADLDTADTSVDRLRGAETGFETGVRYDPSSWDAPLYIAYEYVDEMSGEETADFTQIESEFVVETAEDSDGNEVTNFETRSRNNQTSDVSSLKEELEQLREEQIAMQEEAQEQDDSSLTFPSIGDSLGFGDLGWLTDNIAGIPVWVWVVGVAGFFSISGDS